MKHKQLLVALVGLIALLLVVGSVYAEGAWSSYISGARVGFTSRTWTDRNIDSANTLIYFQGCSTSTNVGLYRNAGEYRGGGWMNCQSSASRSFGRQPAGNYYFRINGISNASTLNVAYVYVGY